MSSRDVQKNIKAMVEDNQVLAARLLARSLPKMQPAALKHAYMNSIINVINHAEAEHVAPDGTRHLIGFGNQERTLPLVVIREGDDGTVRHAFPPKETDPVERHLLVELQKREGEWALAHDTPQRNIAQQIRNRGRRDVTLYGINIPDPPPRTMAHELHPEPPWLPTRPISIEHEIDGDRPLDLEPGSRHMRKLSANASTSAQMAGRGLGPSSLDAHLVVDKKTRTLQLDDLTYYGPEEEGPELG